ncbi:hypothetical protein PRIPAC_92215 [Pristionchus pacificus]|uniref:Uncharacterized protein n=1 Tax=Pristionchus pacificus TaxID=54126 RepID=A0A2A6CDH2_PRIPA|nr:hypothetical protein PRIPAC_92215 [Pristionchus pacificus]|eukprot:PDM76051.1 hypothetical protein PRIPAC_39655 [Pristionchus pacificus]
MNEPGSSVNSSAVDHSIFNPAFAKLNDIKHAQKCQAASHQDVCTIPNCMETKCLLDHVYKCSDEQFMQFDQPQQTWECTYPDCDLARVLLDHSQGLPHILPGCPICKKQEVLRRLHPGKGPRAADSDDDDDEENVKRRKVEDLDPDDQDSKLLKFIRLAMMPRRNIQMKEDPKKTEIDRLDHSNACRKSDCPISHCAYYKGLLLHLNACRKEHMCMSNLISKDLLSNVPAAVAREIFHHIRLNNFAIRSLERVNRSFRAFLRDEKELRGLYEKRVYDKLSICQTTNRRIVFRFIDYRIRFAGHVFIFDTEAFGAVEVVHYSRAHYGKAKKYLRGNYPLCSPSVEPIRIPEEVYRELSLALLRYSFSELSLRSIIIDNDFLSFFVDRASDIFAIERSLRYFNVRTENAVDLDKKEMEDFLAVLDINESCHDCLTDEQRKRDCHGLLINLPTCGCVAFPVIEPYEPTKRSLLAEPYFACSYSLNNMEDP